MSGAVAVEVSAPITITVANVRNDRGMVRVALCPRAKFLGDVCAIHGEARAHAGVTMITIRDVPPGDYAAQAFHDENSNGRVDRALFGVPREGVGFSRDARIVLSPPKWEDAVFTHTTAPKNIRFSLRYFLGKSGP